MVKTLFGILGLLNIAFFALTLVLVVRFLRTGGLAMLLVMNHPGEAPMTPAHGRGVSMSEHTDETTE